MGHVRVGRRLVAGAAVALVSLVGLATPAVAEGQVLAVAEAVPDSYVVVLNDSASPRAAAASTAAGLAGKYGGAVTAAWGHALNGFAAKMSASQARRLAADPKVAFVQQDQVLRVADVQPNPPSWGLDRIDQRDLPLDQSYTYDTAASNVRAYILDTGIRITHSTFGGRATWGTNTVDSNNTDCHGHGTHVAGTVGGSQYGVAKGVPLIAVKVLNCQGSGTTAGVVNGVDWVTQNAVKPAVANMSLGGGADAALDTAVRNSIASGVTYSLASGNSSANACNSSPARVAEGITVNASDSADRAASFTNFGTCTDIFAPGVGITSAWMTNDTATNTISGTSMAAPHVAGAAALWLATHPNDSPAAVATALVNNSTPNKITNPGTGSPNRLLYTAPGGGTPGSPSVTNPGSRTGVVGTATSLQLSASGGTTPYSWAATGLPAGLSINAATGLISGTPTTAGTSTVTATVTDSGNRTGSATFTWTITAAPVPGCTGTNGTDVAIPDLSTVESTITIAGCAGNASATSTVEVHIVHTYIGDLVVTLVAPDGSTYVLHNRAGGSADNINQTYTVNVSTEVANGAWKLRVQDAASADTGRIDTWTLSLGGGGTPACGGTNGTDVTIPDLSTVESSIPVSGCTGNASSASTVEVHIVHTYIGDLVVTLVAPDGSTYVLHNRAGGSADNINQTYTVNLSGEARNGTWRLRVQDAAAADTGRIDSWTLTL
ncbi:proprotein convertase P-domain-containing protein [Actinokineospora sp. HUAS TT18]|uniref:proprotein convertase P-domain-containing protein n=1 Tax=Actinokineospora sp. HUAS TT18 TaxID=3447451 RepID=UPI003F5211CE